MVVQYAVEQRGWRAWIMIDSTENLTFSTIEWMLDGRCYHEGRRQVTRSRAPLAGQVVPRDSMMLPQSCSFVQNILYVCLIQQIRDR